MCWPTMQAPAALYFDVVHTTCHCSLYCCCCCFCWRLPLLPCSLCDVFIIRGSVHDPHALMAANAERAAVAVLLQPQSSSTPGSGSSCASCTDDSMSAVGPADAHIVAAANTLSSINPNIQVGTAACSDCGLGAALCAGSTLPDLACEWCMHPRFCRVLYL